MYTTENELQHYTTAIEQRLQHTYLNKHIQKPVIDEDKLYLLNTILNQTTISDLQKENYIVTTMLVQIALDIHDKIPKKNDTNASNILQNQLHVLAGDYYSGLYYMLLSESNEFSLIHTLANAIKQINEQKMVYHDCEFDTFEELTIAMKEIESLLLTHIAYFVNEPELNPFIGNWVLLNRLNKELQHFKEHSLSNSCVYYKCSLNEFIENVEKQRKQTREVMKKLPDKYSELKVYAENKLVEQLEEG